MPCLFLSPMLLLVASLMLTLWWVAFGLSKSHRRAERTKAGVCDSCGYALAGLWPKEGVLLCPECGVEYRRRPAAATGRAGWMWAWPVVLAVLAAVPLTDRWWYRAPLPLIDDEGVLVIPNLASGGGLMVVVLVFALSKRVRARERLAVVIAAGSVQVLNAVSWSVWTTSIVAGWG